MGVFLRCLQPTPASAKDETADEPTVPDSGWSIEGTTLTITGEGAVENSSLSSTYKWQARKIVISEGVTTIGHNVFQSFSSVEEVSFPTTLTSIGEGAFKGCSSLTSVTMASVESIGRDAFEDCVQLASIILPKTLSNLAAFAFSGCDKLTTVEFLGSVPDGESVGLSLSSETQVIFPANDQTWTDDARTRFSGNPDKLYLRNEDGSLTKVPYVREQSETEVRFGGSETVSIKGSPSSATLSFSVLSDMTVRIYFGYWR